MTKWVTFSDEEFASHQSRYRVFRRSLATNGGIRGLWETEPASVAVLPVVALAGPIGQRNFMSTSTVCRLTGLAIPKVRAGLKVLGDMQLIMDQKRINGDVVRLQVPYQTSPDRMRNRDLLFFPAAPIYGGVWRLMSHEERLCYWAVLGLVRGKSEFRLTVADLGGCDSVTRTYLERGECLTQDVYPIETGEYALFRCWPLDVVRLSDVVGLTQSRLMKVMEGLQRFGLTAPFRLIECAGEQFTAVPWRPPRRPLSELLNAQGNWRAWVTVTQQRMRLFQGEREET